APRAVGNEKTKTRDLSEPTGLPGQVRDNLDGRSRPAEDPARIFQEKTEAAIGGDGGKSRVTEIHSNLGDHTGGIDFLKGAIVGGDAGDSVRAEGQAGDSFCLDHCKFAADTASTDLINR